MSVFSKDTIFLICEKDLSKKLANFNNFKLDLSIPVNLLHMSTSTLVVLVTWHYSLYLLHHLRYWVPQDNHHG